MKSEYFVQYGVNNSHMTEYEQFQLYRDARECFEKLDPKWESAVVFKQDYTDQHDDSGMLVGSYVGERTYKLHRFPAGDNGAMIMAMAEGRKL